MIARAWPRRVAASAMTETRRADMWWMRNLFGLLAALTLTVPAHAADYTPPQGRIGEACSLIDFANTDASLLGDWHADAGTFLLKHCRNQSGAMDAFEKACNAFKEASDPYPPVCKKAERLAREVEAASREKN